MKPEPVVVEIITMSPGKNYDFSLEIKKIDFKSLKSSFKTRKQSEVNYINS